MGSEPSAPCADNNTSPSSDGWRLKKATLDLSLLRATQSQDTYSQETVAQAEWHPCGHLPQRTIEEFIASYDSKHAKTGTTVNRAIELKLQQLFGVSETETDERYWSATARGFHNSSLGLYLENSFGIGLGTLRVFTAPTGTLPPSLQLDADLRVIDERFYKVPGSTRLVGVLLAERYSRRIGVATVTEALQVIPVFNESHAWQGRGILDITAPLNHAQTFGLLVKLSDDYLGNAPSAFRKTYLKVTVGVAFSPVAH